MRGQRVMVISAHHLLLAMSCCVAVTCAWLDPVRADEPGRLPVTAVAKCSGPFETYPESDIGLLPAYCGESLLLLDLLDRGRPLHDPRALPGFAGGGVAFHLSATPHLLITAADAGLLDEERRREGAKSSYLLDLVADTYVWEKSPLPSAARVFAFAGAGTAVLWSGEDRDTFTAIDFRTGDRLWSDTIPAEAAWASGSVLEVVGTLTCTLDGRSGARLRETALPVPKKAAVVVDAESGRFVVARKDKLVAYHLPPVEDEHADVPSLSTLWERESLSTERGCMRDGLCGLVFLPDDRLMVWNGYGEELIDLATGGTLWRRKRRLLAESAPGLPLSRQGSYGAYVRRKWTDVIDLKTGERGLRIAHAAIERGLVVNAGVRWIDDREGLLTVRDERGRPTTIARFAADQPQPIWTTTLPPPATFKLTGKGRGKLVGLILALAAVSAVSIDDPAAAMSPLDYYYFFAPAWRARPPQRRAASIAAVDEDALNPSELAALQRFRRRADIVETSRTGELLFVSGGKEQFDVFALSVDDGSVRTLGRHSGTKVHAIQPDPAYWLALTIEDNEKTLKMLDLHD